MKNFVAAGALVDATAPYALASGAGALVGDALFGVATMDAENGAAVTLAVEGIFDLAKTSAQAWDPGARIYWDDSGKVCTTVATDLLEIGVAVAAAANPSATGRVRLGVRTVPGPSS